VVFKRVPVALFAILLLAASTVSYAVKMPPPPTKADLAGVWVGPDDSGSVLRLDLDHNGKGTLTVSGHNPRFTSMYTVILVKINIYKLTFSVQSVGGEKVGFTLTGTFHPHAIQLQRHLSIFDQTWTHKALLLRSKALHSGFERVQAVH
jgi:hypothetical protein